MHFAKLTATFLFALGVSASGAAKKPTLSVSVYVGHLTDLGNDFQQIERDGKSVTPNNVNQVGPTIVSDISTLGKDASKFASQAKTSAGNYDSAGQAAIGAAYQNITTEAKSSLKELESLNQTLSSYAPHLIVGFQSLKAGFRQVANQVEHDAPSQSAVVEAAEQDLEHELDTAISAYGGVSIV